MMRIGYSKKFRRKLFSAFIFNFERKRIINFAYFIANLYYYSSQKTFHLQSLVIRNSRYGILIARKSTLKVLSKNVSLIDFTDVKLIGPLFKTMKCVVWMIHLQ